MMRRGAEVEESPVGEPSVRAGRLATKLAVVLEGVAPKPAAGVAFGLVLAAVVVEVLAGFELSLLLLYAVPVALAAWTTTGRTAYFVALVAATLPTVVSALLRQPIGWAAMWSTVSDLTLLGIIAILLATLRRRLVEEAAFVATDTLTGLPNRGSFMARLEDELSRAARYGRAFTLAYVDLDNFKAVNDLEGHDAGDELLRRVADTLRSSTRQTDVLGRLGGDEFGVVLPETAGSATGSVLENMRKQLIKTMATAGWPVTFSIGAVTFEVPIDTGREALQVADQAMYTVKRSGKDGINYVVWDGDPG